MLSVIDIVLLCLVHSSTVQRLVTSEEGTCLHDVPSKGDNEHYPNRVILENAGLPPMTDILIQMNLRWLGHLEGWTLPGLLGSCCIPSCMMEREIKDGLGQDSRTL